MLPFDAEATLVKILFFITAMTMLCLGRVHLNSEDLSAALEDSVTLSWNE